MAVKIYSGIQDRRLRAFVSGGIGLVTAFAIGISFPLHIAANDTLGPVRMLALFGAALAVVSYHTLGHLDFLRALTARKRRTFLLASLIAGYVGLLLLPAVKEKPASQTLIIRALGTRNPEAKGSEVWVTIALPDGRTLTRDDVKLEGAWDVRFEEGKTYFLSSSGQPAQLTWQGVTAGTFNLNFYNHDWAGMAEVELGGIKRPLDLYRRPTTGFELQAKAASYFWPELLKCSVIPLSLAWLLIGVAAFGLKRPQDAEADPREWIVPGCLFFLTICLFFFPIVISQTKTMFDPGSFGPTVKYNYQGWYSVDDSTRQLGSFYATSRGDWSSMIKGDLPLWDPSFGLGFPYYHRLLLNNLPFFLLGPVGGWIPFWFVKLLLAGMGLYLLLRHFAVDRDLAFLGGLTFMFSGQFLLWIQTFNGNTACLLPLLILAVEWIVEGRGRRWFNVAFGGLLLSLMMSNYFRIPELLSSLFFIILYIPFTCIHHRIWRVGAYHAISIALSFLLILIIGLTLSMPNLLAGLDLLKNSFISYSTERVFEHPSFLFIPQLLFSPNNFGFGGFPALVHVPALAFLLVPLGFMIRDLRIRAMAIFLVLANLTMFDMPWLTRILDATLLAHKPFSYLYWLKYYYVPTLCFSVLAMAGLQRLRQGEIRRVKPVFWFAGAIVAGELLLIHWHEPAYVFDLYGLYKHYTMNPSVYWTLAFTLIVLAVFWSFTRGGFRRWRPMLGLCLILLMFLWIGVAMPMSRIPDRPKDYYQADPHIEALIKAAAAQTEPFRITAAGDKFFFPLWPAYYGLTDIRTSYPQQLKYANRMLTEVYPTRETEYWFAAGSSSTNAPLADRALDLLNVKYVVTSDPLDDLDQNGMAGKGRYRLIARNEGGAPGWVWENRTVMPRAFLAPAWKPVRDDEENTQTLLDPAFDFRRVATIADTAGLPPSPAPGPVSPPAGKVTIQEYKRMSVTLEAEAAADCILVLTDAWYPHWRVYVDEAERPLLRADYAFRGVHLTKGNHNVLFRFEPGLIQATFVPALYGKLGLVLFFLLYLAYRLVAGAPRRDHAEELNAR